MAEKSPCKDIQLLVRAPCTVVIRKGSGWRKPSLAGSFVFPRQ